LSRILLQRTWPCRGGGRAQERGRGVSEISCHGSMYIRSMTLSVSRTVSLSHTQAFVHPCTRPLSNHSLTHSLYFKLSYFISLSLSLSLLLSVVFAFAFSFRLSVGVALSSLHTHSRTRSHMLSLIHPLTNARTHQIFMSIFLAHSHTFLYLSLSFSLSLSLSLLHTYTDTHTHSHSHTLSFMNWLIHSFIVVACARCVVFSARTRTRSLLSVSLPLPPFLVRFLSDSVSFVLFLPSRWLASSPSLSHSFASSLFQLPVTMISI